jgi:hypothetical protein
LGSFQTVGSSSAALTSESFSALAS